MILDAHGRTATQTTETTVDPRLVEMLSALEDLLVQTGLTLRCFRCEALGLSAKVHGDNDQSSDTLRITCACATRTYHRRTGKVKVWIN